MHETPEDMLLAYVASLFLAVALKGRKYFHCIGKEAKARAVDNAWSQSQEEAEPRSESVAASLI